MPPLEAKPPELIVDRWVQGGSETIAGQCGKVILIEVFQVNCPGCFAGGLPEAIALYGKYRDRGLVVWGLATAFEDFDKNNLENLKRLLATGEPVGETLRCLASQNLLVGGRLGYEIPFPVAWDRLEKSRGAEAVEVQKIIDRDIPGFSSFPAKNQETIRRQVSDYLKRKPWNALTFEAYQLRGTPSSILIDRRGFLRHKLFGFGLGLENHVQTLLSE